MKEEKMREVTTPPPAENYTQNLEGDDQECCCVEFQESTLLAPGHKNKVEECCYVVQIITLSK